MSKYKQAKAEFKELDLSANYEDMENWADMAINMYNKNQVTLADIIYPLVNWFQDVHLAIETLEDRIGMNAEEILEWYDKQYRC